jgi:hypothetical protein
MPSLPQQPTLPDHRAKEWPQQLTGALIQTLRPMTRVINLLCQVGTQAQRPAVPDLDEIFYHASDTGETYVGVDGAWQNIGTRRGSASVTAGASTASVTFSVASTTASYRVSLTPDWNAGGMWVTSKATTGFTVNAATVAPGGGGTVDWMLQRDV